FAQGVSVVIPPRPLYVSSAQVSTSSARHPDAVRSNTRSTYHRAGGTCDLFVRIACPPQLENVHMPVHLPSALTSARMLASISIRAASKCCISVDDLAVRQLIGSFHPLQLSFGQLRVAPTCGWPGQRGPSAKFCRFFSSPWMAQRSV